MDYRDSPYFCNKIIFILRCAQPGHGGYSVAGYSVAGYKIQQGSMFEVKIPAPSMRYKATPDVL